VSPRQRTRGFTLIELLVVLVIIGIVVSIAVVSLNALGRDPPAEKAAQQIADLAGLAAEQAVMQGQEYGLRIEPHAFEFYVYDGRNWSLPKDDELFRRRELGDDVNLSLVLDGTPVKLAPPASTANQDAAAAAASASASASSDAADRPLPQVLLLSSGELPTFEVDVSGSGDPKDYAVKGTLADGIRMIAPGDAAEKK
jgi:general secretion pathway protein H